MSKRNVSQPVATKAPANVIRAFFVENPNLVPEGDKSVGKPAGQHRGRISPAAREVAAQNGLVYDAAAPKAGSTITLPVTKTSKSGATLKRPVEVTMAEFRRLSQTTKGRPSKDSVAKAAAAYMAENGLS